MKTTIASLGGLQLLLAARQAAAHATFQQLWINGVDYGGQCVRQPPSNSPVTDVSSNDVRCNANVSPAGAKCAVAAGDTVTVEMHQQTGDRSCANEAIGGQHYGPVMVYMSKVDDSATNPGDGGWFKVYQDGWAKNPSGGSGDDDFWGNKDMNACCGKVSLTVPAGIPSGDYLLRAETIALHVAGQRGGAQLYMSCFQLTVTGGSSGGSVPGTVVRFPGAYDASDPGILVNIHAAVSGYAAPGPAVVAGGTTKSAGSGCVGCEATCTVGSGPSGTATSVPLPSGGGGGGGGGGCTAAKYQQCGGEGYTGCTNCQSGTTCVAVSPPYYYQCA